MNTRAPLLTLAAAALALQATACRQPSHAVTAAPDDVPAWSVPVTGRIIEVRMVTDERGNYFAPARITARPGDVLRLRLVSGVHNLSFFPAGADSAILPSPTGLLQAEGQTMDVPVSLPPGQYRFQCDPHAQLGMVGTLTVE